MVPMPSCAARRRSGSDGRTAAASPRRRLACHAVLSWLAGGARCYSRGESRFRGWLLLTCACDDERVETVEVRVVDRTCGPGCSSTFKTILLFTRVRGQLSPSSSARPRVDSEMTDPLRRRTLAGDSPCGRGRQASYERFESRFSRAAHHGPHTSTATSWERGEIRRKVERERGGRILTSRSDFPANVPHRWHMYSLVI